MLLFINIIGFTIPYIIILTVSVHFAHKNNIPFKVVLKFNGYVKNTIGMTVAFQIVILLIDLFMFAYVGQENDYSSAETLTIVTCANLMLFDPALSLTVLDCIKQDTRNIKKLLPSMPIKF